ncbi:EamA family transporter [Paraburkholderia acidicola]|uniref:EamA family transporter n=1 Tax=Paraburkholderia acidicola TaxID=1912599 RepID=A0A2A4ERC3_9BURK|nr:DMT family transporter [Paraburkholderia acidicola]PCE23237.1 EamA family transporter [Paraburkholderia acidicola]
MAILMGLISALCWGITDFLAGHTTRQIGVTRSLFYSQSFGFLVLTVSMVFHPSLFHFGVKGFGLAMAVLAAVCNLIAMASLLKALSIGKASVVAPIVSLYGAVTTVLSVIAGERITTMAVASLVLCIFGASLAGISKSSDGKPEAPASIGLALLSALMFGLGFWFQGAFAVKDLGIVGTLWVYYLVAVVVLFAVLVGSRNLSPPRGSILALILTISLLSLFGFSALAYGSGTGHVAIVTVLSSLASAVTAVLGFAIRGERPSVPQWIGISIITFGVVSLKLTSGIVAG